MVHRSTPDREVWVQALPVFLHKTTLTMLPTGSSSFVNVGDEFIMQGVMTAMD